MKRVLLILSVYLLLGQAAYSQHVLSLEPATAADTPLLRKYRYRQQHPDSLAALQEAHALLRQLYADGYLLAHFKQMLQGTDSTIARVLVGQPYQWISLSRGNVEERMLQTAGYRERFYREKPFSYNQVSRLLQRLLQQAERNGYPFALFRLDSLEIIQSNIKASLFYEPGPYITFDSLQLSGNASLRQRFLADHLGIVPGSAFNQERLDEIRERLEELPFVRLAEAPTLSFQNSQARVGLRLRRVPANRIDGILGLQSKPGGGLLLTGQLDMLLQNPFGSGKTLGLNWQRLNEESQLLELAYRHPYLFSSPISLALEAGLLKEQEQFLNRNAGLALQIRQSRGLLLSLEYRFKDSRMLEEARGPDLASFRVHRYGLRAEWRKLDNRLFPRQGWVLGAGVLAGPKQISRVADGSKVEAGKSLQFTSELAAEAYRPLASRTVLALRASGALLLDKNIFLPDLYRLGGLLSLRGFREKSLFASHYALFSSELRQQLGNSSYLFLFYDQGLLYYQMGAGRYRDWPLGIGAGLSLQTAGGQFNLVYALGHQQNLPFSIRNSQVHFGYTSRF